MGNAFPHFPAWNYESYIYDISTLWFTLVCLLDSFGIVYWSKCGVCMYVGSSFLWFCFVQNLGFFSQFIIIVVPCHVTWVMFCVRREKLVIQASLYS